MKESRETKGQADGTLEVYCPVHGWIYAYDWERDREMTIHNIYDRWRKNHGLCGD